jgi:hypothetical protein
MTQLNQHQGQEGECIKDLHGARRLMVRSGIIGDPATNPGRRSAAGPILHTLWGLNRSTAVARDFEAVGLGILRGQKGPLRGLQFLEWPG